MPKILFITADQWRGDCLGVAGHACVRTPNLDALAADGLRFTRHYAQCSPCGPSRASLHTGMYLMNHRSARNGSPLDGRFTNLALELAAAGLETALIGYTDTSVDPRGLASTDPRLRTYTGVMPGYRPVQPDLEGPIAWTRHLRSLGYDARVPGHPEDDSDLWLPVPDYPGSAERGPTFAPTRYPPAHSDTAFSVDLAIDYLQERAGSDWSLHLSLLRPHPPYIAPAPFNAMHAPDDGPPFRRHPDAATEAAQHPYAGFNLALTRAFLAEHGLDMSNETYRRQLRATYWGMMAEVDHHLGRLFDALRASGDYRDTCIVFTSDHGEQLWDHWMLGKRSYHDQSFHIPLLVKAPATPDAVRGGSVDAFTENVDIMPTLLAQCGLPVPDQCDGVALTDWLRGEPAPDWRQAAFFELDFRDVEDAEPERALGLDLESCSFSVLRGARHKYVHFTALPPLLFDLQADPGELHNLAGERDRQGLVCGCAQALLSHRMRHAERTLTGLCLSRKQGLVRASAARRRARSGQPS